MVLQAASVTDILESMKDRNSSHLFEVIQLRKGPRRMEAPFDRSDWEAHGTYPASWFLQVVLHAVPDNLFVEMFQRFFRHHLLELSLHESANFVVQALISAARHEGQVCLLVFVRKIIAVTDVVRITIETAFMCLQVNMIFDELGERFAELIKERRAGVIASIVAACARFHTRQREVHETLLEGSTSLRRGCREGCLHVCLKD